MQQISLAPKGHVIEILKVKYKVRTEVEGNFSDEGKLEGVGRKMWERRARDESVGGVGAEAIRHGSQSYRGMLS